MSSQLVMSARERQDLIRRYHDSFCGTFGYFPDGLPPTRLSSLAGAMWGCALISGLIYRPGYFLGIGSFSCSGAGELVGY